MLLLAKKLVNSVDVDLIIGGIFVVVLVLVHVILVVLIDFIQDFVITCSRLGRGRLRRRRRLGFTGGWGSTGGRCFGSSFGGLLFGKRGVIVYEILGHEEVSGLKVLLSGVARNKMCDCVSVGS